MRIGLVVPHVFMHEAILPRVIFSPGRLAVQLADGLVDVGHEVTLFSPGPVGTRARNVIGDLGAFERELAVLGLDYIGLLKESPLRFVTLARQVQAELVADAYERLDRGELDIVHVYTNEEELALPFSRLTRGPVVFTHHDPFNLLAKYRSVFPKYADLNWISVSLAHRKGMPADTNWVGNVYHGLDPDAFPLRTATSCDYVLYLGRIIEQKGVHLAIEAARKAGVKLKIAGKHYAGKKNDYWATKIAPELDDQIEYVGFVSDETQKRELIANATALIVPSVFEEPFGMVMIEALACGTPVVGRPVGAIPEVIRDGVTGFVTDDLAGAIRRVGEIDRAACRRDFEECFTLERMVRGHEEIYRHLTSAASKENAL